MTRRVRTLALALGIGMLAGGAWAQPAPAPAGASYRLTLADALARGVQENLQAVLAAGDVKVAEGEREQALARLYPQLEVGLAASRQKINLAAYGLSPPPPESPLVGPFDVVDGRVRGEWDLLDPAALARASAARQRLEASRLTYQQAKDAVVAAVADLYLRNLADRARIASAQAQLATAEAAARQAEDRHSAGTNPAIDALRAQVQLAQERESLIQAQSAAQQHELQLARAVGLEPGTPLELVDALPFAAIPDRDTAAAVAAARGARADLAAARAAAEAADRAVSAARREHLPSLAAMADYGKIGPDVPSALVTYSVGAALRIPLFEGGRISGAVRAAEGRAEQAHGRLADLERQVDLEVRSALLDVRTAAQQVEVTRQGLALAQQQVEQATDRFAAGVTSSLEVVQAQEALALASEREVRSLYEYNRAKVALALSLGVAGRSTVDYLQGVTP